MKPLLLAAMLLFSASANASLYDEPDKVLHTKYSAIGANVLKAMGATTGEAFVGMLIIGVIKELGDNNSASEHRKDMLANIIGASTVFVWEIKF